MFCVIFINFVGNILISEWSKKSDLDWYFITTLNKNAFFYLSNLAWSEKSGMNQNWKTSKRFHSVFRQCSKHFAWAHDSTPYIYNTQSILPFSLQDKVKITPYSESASETANYNISIVPDMVKPRVLDDFDFSAVVEASTTTEPDTVWKYGCGLLWWIFLCNFDEYESSTNYLNVRANQGILKSLLFNKIIHKS